MAFCITTMQNSGIVLYFQYTREKRHKARARRLRRISQDIVNFLSSSVPLFLRLADSGSITSKKYFSSVSFTLSFNTGSSQLRGKLHGPPLKRRGWNKSVIHKQMITVKVQVWVRAKKRERTRFQPSVRGLESLTVFRGLRHFRLQYKAMYQPEEHGRLLFSYKLFR